MREDKIATLKLPDLGFLSRRKTCDVRLNRQWWSHDSQSLVGYGPRVNLGWSGLAG